ncbi:uncharacterized protein LOC119771828 isoform X2 [Cyprinodon tularosa]|uniref:uncharacterized protein LOC119771828 isoform X2 n=1 Tax=Cyprinodon tularosa TaxID=77115 RepID=UPI0018E25D1D|nr:uncharacterized protein LOC119771828 isoform X2 [Cyprinodon tularosa]
MLTMKAYKWILLFALWLLSVSSNGRELCNRTEVKAPLGSSVSLPCTISSNGSKWVKWSHKYEKDEAGVELVDLSSNGRINFLDPRSGRVKIFPNQFSEMNYGIIIDELKDSDMGSYYCKQSNECFEVKLFEDEGKLSSEMKLLIYSSGGVAALIIISLLIICYWLKCVSNKGSAMPTVSETTQGATTTPSAPPQEAGGVNGQQIAGDDNGLVYENDDQYIASIRNSSVEPAVMQHPNGSQPNQSDIGIYPNLDEFKFERVESERTRQRFHIELFSRIRQASVNRHFYVNQGEIRKQQARAAQAENKKAGKGRRKAKDSCEYKNPIYNSSNDYLNHL